MACSVALAELASESSRLADTAEKRVRDRQTHRKHETLIENVR